MDLRHSELRAAWPSALTISELAQSPVVGPPTAHLRQRSAYLAQRLEAAFGSDERSLVSFLAANGVNRAELLDTLAANRAVPLTDQLQADLLAIAPNAGTAAVIEDPWEDQLDAVLSPLIEHGRAQGIVRVTQGTRGPERAWKRAACEVVMRQSPSRLRALVTGPLVLEMSSLGDSLPEGREGYTAAVNRFATDPSRWLALMGTYPVMARLLLTGAKRWVNTSVELVNRLWKDRTDLCAWLGLKQVTVRTAVSALGDLHATGSVTQLTTDDGTRFYYKPRSLALADGFAALAKQVDSLDGSWRAIDFLPDHLSREGYGWIREVTAGKFSDDGEVERYYERLGYLGALAWVLNSVDLHCFNVIAAQQGPVILDFETLLTPSGLRQSPRPPSPLEHAASGTGILPTLSTIGGATTGIDFSAFGAIVEEAPFTERFWEAAGTTSMRLSYRRGTLAPLSQPVSRGGPVDPHRFHDAFLRGFSNMLEFVAARSARFVRAASEVPELRHAPIRVVLRPTAEYARFLTDSLHPGFLTDQILRQIHFTWLWRNRADGLSDGVLSAELDALLVDDVVPSWWTFADSTDLFLGQTLVERNVFERTASEVLSDRISSLNATSISRLVWSAQAALATGTLERASDAVGECCADPGPQVADSALLADAAAAILRRLAELSFDSVGVPAWVDLWSNNGALWRLDVIDESLYRGRTGMFVAFETAAQFFQHREDVSPLLRKFSDDLWLAFTRSVEDAKPDLVGAYEGLGGHLYAAALSYGGRREAGQLIDVLLRIFAEADPRKEVDVSRGSAGAILCLLAVAERVPGQAGDRALAIAQSYGEALLEASHVQGGRRWWGTVGGLPIAGFAHGSAGITLAMRVLADRLAASMPHAAAEFLSAAKQGEHWEHDQYDDGECNWVDLRPGSAQGIRQFSTGWCNGSAGIGLARLHALRLATTDPTSRRRFRLDVRSALESSKHGLGRGQTLCHGDLGVALLHLEAGRRLHQKEHVEFALRVGAMVANDVLYHDGAVKSGVRYMRDTPALMNGGAGVALGLLHLASPETIPNLLLIGA